MNFFAEGPWVKTGAAPLDTKGSGILRKNITVLLISDEIENREKVAQRVAELLTKHWMED